MRSTTLPHASRITVAALTLALLACGGSSDTGPTPTASLAVTVSAPGGVSTPVFVSGPNGYSQTLSGTQTLTGLAPGNYVVSAAGGGSTDPIVGELLRGDYHRQPRGGDRRCDGECDRDVCVDGNDWTSLGRKSARERDRRLYIVAALGIGHARARDHDRFVESSGRTHVEHRGRRQRRDVGGRRLRHALLLQAAQIAATTTAAPTRCDRGRGRLRHLDHGHRVRRAGKSLGDRSERPRHRILRRAARRGRNGDAEHHAHDGVRLDHAPVGRRLRFAREPVGRQLRQQLRGVVHAVADRGEWLTAAVSWPHWNARDCPVRSVSRSITAATCGSARSSTRIAEFPASSLSAVGSPTPVVMITGRISVRRSRSPSTAAARSWVASYQGNQLQRFLSSQLASTGAPTPSTTISGTAVSLPAKLAFAPHASGLPLH